MTSYCNREQAGKAIALSLLKKRQDRYTKLQPSCKICGVQISFEDFTKGRKELCKAKGCRAIINKENGSKQDKSKISEKIRSSEKWKSSVKEHLERNKSRIEVAYEKVFRDFFQDVETQVNVVLDDGSNKFIDFRINGVFVEIDGPYHKEEVDSILNKYCSDRAIPLVRVNVAKHWTLVFEDVGLVLKKIGGLS